MGRKQKEKAVRMIGQPHSIATGTELLGDFSIPSNRSYVSCQAIVGQDRINKCGALLPPGATKWCDYHTEIRQNLHSMFHGLLMEYRAMAVPLPEMRVVRETIDLDWLKGFAEPLRARINVLGRCLLNRVCFMERMQGEDLSFGTKNTIKDLKDARTRLQGHLQTIEQRMSVLILCSYEDQNPIAGLAAQLLDRVDRSDQRCTHHEQNPRLDLGCGLMFPVARRHHREVARKGVVDLYLDRECMRLRKLLLAKMGVQVVEGDEGAHLVVHWPSLVDHERAHIAASYFRRIIWNQAHLFVLAYLHTCSFKERTIDFPKIVTPFEEILDPIEDIDTSMLCMITFLLNPTLQATHLEILWDFIIWPAHLEVRTAVQDVIIGIRNFTEETQDSGQPYWAEPIRIDLCWLNDDDPTGTVEFLCGTLFEAAYPQATRDDTFEPRFWSHIGSLVRCGKCLFAMVYSSDQWCDLVRIFAAHRIPLYDQILPQIIGSAPGDLWSTDRASDHVRGQSQSEGDQSGQAPCARYRLDELLELAGLTMLGIIEGGPVDTRGVTDAGTEGFMKSFLLLPQVWFALPSAYDRMAKAIIGELLKRSQEPDATFTFRATIPDDDSLNRVLMMAPRHYNVLQRYNALRQYRDNTLDWSLAQISLSDMRFITRMKYDPLPRRIEYDTCLVEIAYKHTAPGSTSAGIQPILDLLLDVCMAANGTSTPSALATKVEKQLENGYKMLKRDHTGAFTYAFDPARVMPLERDSGSDVDAPHYFGSPTTSDKSSSLSSSETDTAISEHKRPSVPVASTGRAEWFDLMMAADADSLPDLSDWNVTSRR